MQARVANLRGGLSGVLGLVFLLILISRLWQLDLKPVHFDEGINGHFVQEIWKHGYYRYDPTNFHGPLYFYLIQISEMIFGRGIISFRIVSVALSLLVILATLGLRRWYGSSAVVASLLVAVSPAFSFYSRYAIHEMLFIFLQVVFFYGVLLWCDARENSASLASQRRVGGNPESNLDQIAILIMSIATALMAAVKETFFIYVGTVLIAAFIVRYGLPWDWHNRRNYQEKKTKKAKDANGRIGFSANKLMELWRRDPTKMLILLAVGLVLAAFGIWLFARFVPFKGVVSLGLLGVMVTLVFPRYATQLVSGFFLLVFIFSAGFLYWSGVDDFFRAFAFWSKTGGHGQGHQKEWYYWLRLFTSYELWAWIGLLVAGTYSLTERPVRERMIALTAFGTFLAYTIIPYKTPWLILNMLWPLALSLGLLYQKMTDGLSRNILNLVMAAAFAHGLYYSYRLNFIDYQSDAEPYVYAQTTNQMRDVVRILNDKVKKEPEKLNMPVVVLNRDTWPLPWVLGEFTKLTFAQPAAWKPTVPPSVVLVDAETTREVENRLSGEFYRLPFKIRHAYSDGFAYLSVFDFPELATIAPRVRGGAK